LKIENLILDPAAGERYPLERPIYFPMTEWNTETAEWYAANYGDYPTNRLAIE
jgi:hypothetical protein